MAKTPTSAEAAAAAINIMNPSTPSDLSITLTMTSDVGERVLQAFYITNQQNPPIDPADVEGKIDNVKKWIIAQVIQSVVNYEGQAAAQKAAADIKLS